jgi:hypothetical protein
MTTAKLYKKHKAGEIGRDKFLYEVRRDKSLPWVTNMTSYDDAVKILKNKGIISEIDANVSTDPAVDKVNPYFLKKGVEKLLSKEEELTNDSYKKALNKAAKQLQKNPHAFDKDMFANAEDVEKADEKLETEEVKKSNHNNKANEMKKVKVKSLKESAIEELTNHLKKKDLVNEDVHYSHTVGSEVHTPDGPGKVTEIIGGTLTVELEDGSLKDYQINTVDHHTNKAAEKQAEPSKDDVKDMWAKWDKEGHKTFGGMVVDPAYHSDLDKKYGKLKEYIAKNKHDKKKMKKLKDALNKLKEAGEKTALITTISGEKTAVDYKTDDELKSIGDNTDIKTLKTATGKKIKE